MKETTDKYLDLDIRDLHRKGLLDDFHDTHVYWPEAVTLYGAKVAPSVHIRTMPPSIR